MSKPLLKRRSYGSVRSKMKCELTAIVIKATHKTLFNYEQDALIATGKSPLQRNANLTKTTLFVIVFIANQHESFYHYYIFVVEFKVRSRLSHLLRLL